MQIDWTIVSCVIGTIALIYAGVRNIKQDFGEKLAIVSNKSADLRNEIVYLHKELKRELKEDIRAVGDDVKLLREEVKDIDRRLCRLEGAFSTKECCMLSHSHGSKEVV